MHETNKGIADIVIILIVLIAIGTVGFLTLRGDQANQNLESQKSATENTNQIPTPNPETADWETYTNKEYSFSFKYPPFYEFTSEEQTRQGYGTVVRFRHQDYNDSKEAWGTEEYEVRDFSVILRKSDLSLENYIADLLSMAEFKTGTFEQGELGDDTDEVNTAQWVDEVSKERINNNNFIVTHKIGAADGSWTYYTKDDDTIVSISNGYGHFVEDEIFNQILSSFEFTSNTDQINENVFSGAIWVYHVDIVNDQTILTVHNQVTSSDGEITEMRIWGDNDENNNWVAYEEYPRIPFDNKIKVFAQFKDEKGNVSGVYSDTVIPPQGPPPQ